MVLRKGYVVGRVSLFLSTFFLCICCFCIYTLVSFNGSECLSHYDEGELDCH